MKDIQNKRIEQQARRILASPHTTQDMRDRAAAELERVLKERAVWYTQMRTRS